MEELLRVPVLHSDDVEIPDLCRSQLRWIRRPTLRIQEEFIPLQRLLERRRHEAISRSRELEDLEVYPEER